jgi:hypothetical protein
MQGIPWTVKWTQTELVDKNTFPKTDFIRSVPQHPFPTEIKPDSLKKLSVGRGLDKNRFVISPGTDTLVTVEIPFVTNGIETALQLLGPNYQTTNTKVSLNQTLYSIPVDSA